MTSMTRMTLTMTMATVSARSGNDNDDNAPYSHIAPTYIHNTRNQEVNIRNPLPSETTTFKVRITQGSGPIHQSPFGSPTIATKSARMPRVQPKPPQGFGSSA